VLLGRGDGTFSPPLTAASGDRSWDAAAGDFNGDGWPDVAAVDGANVSVLLNDRAWPPADAPAVTITGGVTVAEGNGGEALATFTVSLSAPDDVPVTVRYATADGTATAAGADYRAASGELTFAPGETSKAVTVAVLGDRLGEPNETFSVNLSGASPYALVEDGQGVATITDDEPRIWISNAGIIEGNSGTRPLVFTVSLSAAYDAPVTINFATADGTARASGGDYLSTSGTLTFAPGETTKTITVLVKGDRKKEATETFYVNLFGATDALIADGQGVGTILDDD
jgi:large repetitive protein